MSQLTLALSTYSIIQGHYFSCSLKQANCYFSVLFLLIQNGWAQLLESNNLFRFCNKIWFPFCSHPYSTLFIISWKTTLLHCCSVIRKKKGKDVNWSKYFLPLKKSLNHTGSRERVKLLHWHPSLSYSLWKSWVNILAEFFSSFEIFRWQNSRKLNVTRYKRRQKLNFPNFTPCLKCGWPIILKLKHHNLYICNTGPDTWEVQVWKNLILFNIDYHKQDSLRQVPAIH